MKSKLQLLFLVTALLGLASGAAASDRWETLRAINLVENPTNHTHYGSKGELGPYQFMSSTWRMHTRKPFQRAIDRATADEVAAIHYEYIKEGLIDAGIAPTVYNIAMAWNCGLGAVTSGRIPEVSYRYGERVRNLVEQMKREQRGNQVAAAESAKPATPVMAPRFVIDSFLPVTVAADAPRYVLSADEIPTAEIPTVKVAAPAPAATSSMFVLATTAAAPRFTLP